MPQVLTPEVMKHNHYRAEIMNMFMSEQFSKSPED
jgi:hypothetical protein